MRSAVANTDDPNMPAGTLRAWILGLIWAVVIPGVNQFYFFRYPNVTIGPVRIPAFCLPPPYSYPSSSSRSCYLFPSDALWPDSSLKFEYWDSSLTQARSQ